MPTYTVEAFRWSGTGYNAQYNTSYTAAITDNDPSYQGGGDGDETVSIDGGPALGTFGQPYLITVNYTDVNGDPHVEDFEFFNAGGNWYFIPEPGSNFTTGSTLGSYQGHTVGWDYSDIVCFARGTRILTENGPLAVEALVPDTPIVTADGTCKPLRRALHRQVTATELAANPKLRPVRIKAGALGKGLPERTLRVSRQHRMLVSSPIAGRMFAKPEVLVAAIRLTRLPGISIEVNCKGVEYFHLVFDEHEVVFAEGAPSESFFPGPQALDALSDAGRAELEALFPELSSAEQLPARFIPDLTLQKRLIARHGKNGKPVLSTLPSALRDGTPDGTRLAPSQRGLDRPTL